MAMTIRALLEGRERPVTVATSSPLSEAVELMLRHDYSQLPVVQPDGTVAGMVTSDSILRATEAFQLPVTSLMVADALIRPRTFDPDGDASELLDTLRDQYAALVLAADGQLEGVITNFDASAYFRERAEDMMLVEDIESSLKDHLLSAFQDDRGVVDEGRLAEAVARCADPAKATRNKAAQAIKAFVKRAQPELHVDQGMVDDALTDAWGAGKPVRFEDLSLGGYIDMLLHQSMWDRYRHAFGMEPDALRYLLNKVRSTRNALAHFRGEIAAADRARLQYCARWLEGHPPRRQVAAPSASHELEGKQGSQTVEVIPVDDILAPGEGRYAKLAVWLEKIPPARDVETLAFSQVEEILGGKLPESARAHRSWWANDSVSHPQSRLWLEIGWRVSSLSLTDESVSFSRVAGRETAYISFFSAVTALLAARGGRLRPASPSGASWLIVARFPETGSLAGWLICSFARGGRVRVEFYIDALEREANKEVFDRLIAKRVDIEAQAGEALSWERLDDRRASRIAVYTTGTITSEDGREPLVNWCAERLDTFHRIFSGQTSHA